MEIQSLKLVVTEADANTLVAEFAPKDLDIKNLQIRFTSEGVRLTGDTRPLMFKISFETLWVVSLIGGDVVVQLNALKVAGVAAGPLRGVLLKMMRDAVAGKAGLSVQEDAVRINVNEVLRAHELPLSVKLTAVRCVDGHIVIEA